MSKVVVATVRFLIDDKSADSLQELLANSPCWINESWLEKYPDIWDKVHTMEIDDVSVENF